MKKARMIRKCFTGVATVEGAGVRLSRFFGSDDVMLFDPFLLLDDFSSDNRMDYNKGFPWHPHRGIETVTYLIKGSVEHGDSLGNQDTICEGDAQWMTAGSGIIHQEMPLGDSHHRISGLQLWLNLPAEQKMTLPRYLPLSLQHIPTIHSGKALCRILAGTIDTVIGPVTSIEQSPVFIDVTMPGTSEFVFPTPTDHTFFIYCLEGKAQFGLFEQASSAPDTNNGNTPELLGTCISDKTVILYDHGDYLSVATGKSSARFIIIGGKPLHEPIAWYGPIVMNSEDELKTAFEEFQLGTFIKHDKKAALSV